MRDMEPAVEERPALHSCRPWFALLTLAMLLLGAFMPAEAAAPVRLEQDVSDITPWLEPYVPAATGTSAPARAPADWKSLEITNPKQEELHRIITVSAGSQGTMRFLARGGSPEIIGVETVGEGARMRIIMQDGRQAAELHLEPFATARFAVQVKDAGPSSVWNFWKPEAIAASQRSNLLVMGLLSGALLVMVSWLTGLAVLRNAPEPAWAAAALTCLVVLVLGQAVLALPGALLMLFGAALIAAALRYLNAHLNWNHFRPRLAVLFDGFAFAIMGFAAIAAAGVDYAWPILTALLWIASLAAAGVAVMDARRQGARARALLPGLSILTATALLPLVLPQGVLEALPGLQLFADALLTAGAIALSFAAAAPAEPELDEVSREQLSEEGRKAREAEYRYALGLAAAHQGLWDWNFETDTLFVSPSVEALLGLEAGAVGNSERRWADLILPEDIAIYADTMNAHRRQGNSSFTLEVRMRHGKGGFRWVQLRASCVANAGGRAMRCIGVVSDITARKAQEQRKPVDDEVDAATGLIQRAAFIKRVDGMLATMTATKTRRHGAVLSVDVDRVRAVIDAMGHEAGNRFLVQIAQRLDHAVGPEDAVARLGGEEFAVLALGSPGDEDGAIVAQRIRDALTQPISLTGRDIYPAASIGLALIEADHRQGAQVLREAELAMYHAKRAGRGGFEIYQPQMKPRSPDRLTMDADLRSALERQQIELHYQPIIRLSDNAVAGFEALMRWRHPQRGLLAPAEFIPLAEETGLIIPLGSYAVERAAVELRRWQQAFPLRNPVFCSVNVSARQLLRQEFFDDVMGILERQNPHRLSLKLEITESVLMQNPDSMADALQHLKDAGAGLALDDFGTGFSSLAYLQRFPFDTVKIDRSFITDMAHNEETPVVLRSIIRLAHDLDMSVVAEGVETQAEADSLRSLQCEFSQGFLFGAPMTANQAYNYLAASLRPAPAPRGLPRPGGSGPSRVPRKL
jgi:diguanylate cyclase (GGDEF)-like protein/PAS domain S-box-containing protein